MKSPFQIRSRIPACLSLPHSSPLVFKSRLASRFQVPSSLFTIVMVSSLRALCTSQAVGLKLEICKKQNARDCNQQGTLQTIRSFKYHPPRRLYFNTECVSYRLAVAAAYELSSFHYKITSRLVLRWKFCRLKLCM